jgi:integrase
VKTKRAETKRIEVKEGNIIVPIYEFTDGRYCVDTMLGETRKRVTRASLEAAKTEARKIIAQIASGRSHEEPLTLAEVEDYRLAKQKLAPHGVSLLTAVEEWIAGRGKTTRVVSKKVPEIIQEFLLSKQVEGVSFFHLEDRKYRLNKFAAAFPGRIDHVTTHEVETWLNGLEVNSRTRNNYRNAALQLFRYARGKRYLPRNEPTAVEDIASANTSEGAIEIYTPKELRLLLANAPEGLLPFFAIGAFAGLRSQEIMRLDWQDIRFGQDFIEVAAAKAKTASRRLAPLVPVLKAWLLPLRKETGNVVGYTRNDSLSEARVRYCNSGVKEGGKVIEFKWKPNALRHSYASYRLAKIKDAARVALEMGNSPSMLFRNYRELVTDPQAEEWFSILPPGVVIPASEKRKRPVKRLNGSRSGTAP